MNHLCPFAWPHILTPNVRKICSNYITLLKESVLLSVSLLLFITFFDPLLIKIVLHWKLTFNNLHKWEQSNYPYKFMRNLKKVRVQYYFFIKQSLTPCSQFVWCTLYFHCSLISSQTILHGMLRWEVIKYHAYFQDIHTPLKIILTLYIIHKKKIIYG